MAPMNARQTAINTAAFLVVLLVAWMLVQVRSTIVLLVIGILFATAIEPLVLYLRKWRLKRGQAILVIYGGILLALVVASYVLIPSVIRQTSDLIENLPEITQDTRERVLSIDNPTIRQTALRGINEVDKVLNGSNTGDETIDGRQALGIVTSVGGVVIAILTVLVVAFYWLTESSIIQQVTLRKVPAEQRLRAYKVWEDIETRLGGWARGQLSLCLIIGVISTIAYFALDVKYWIALGIFAGITEIIPLIGPVIGGAAAAAIALTDSWEKAAAVVVFAVILQQVESALLVPRVMRSAVGMSPLTVILAVLFGSTLAGPLGAILAIPVGASIQVIIQEIIQDQREHAETSESRAAGGG